MQIALIGGTGKLGTGLARHLAGAGHAVIIGSRDQQRAQQCAEQLLADHPTRQITGASNLDAALNAELAVVTIPFESVAGTIEPLRQALAGKVVLSTVVPLRFDGRGPAPLLVEAGSAAEQIAALLPESRVTAALHSVSSAELRKNVTLDADSLICGDDDGAVQSTSELVGAVAGLRPIIAGGLRLAGACEQMTAGLLCINQRYKAHAGLRITGLEVESA